MDLKKYIEKITSQFSKKSIQEKAENLIKKIIKHKTIQIWKISDNRNEYERLKTMLDNSLKSVLDDKKYQKHSKKIVSKN